MSTPDKDSPRKQDQASESLMRETDALIELREIVVRRELELMQLQNDVAQFQSLYTAIVGARQIELDSTQARLARAIADLNPGDADLAKVAAEAEERAANATQPKNARAEDVQELHPEQAQILRKLFREVARRVHPDLAIDPEAIEIRNELMREAQLAYKEHDIERLLQMYETYSDLDGQGDQEPDAQRVRMATAQLRLRLKAIEESIDMIKDGFLYYLMLRARDAENADRDLLAEMVERIDAEIAQIEKQIEALTEGSGGGEESDDAR